MKRIILFAFTLLLSGAAYAQPERYLREKPGQWRYETNLPEKAYRLQNYSMTASENMAFRKNVAGLAEWFRQNVPMLTSPKGYDLRALSNYVWGDWTTKSEAEYGIPADLGFLFELFFTDGSKWKVEPPQYRFQINNIAGAHENYYTPDTYNNDGTRYDLSKESIIEKARRKLCGYFPVYPFREKAAEGVDVYEENPGGRTRIVVFNPERPPYWLPVTMKELADASIEYFSLFNKIELDRMVFEQLKKEIAELTPEELAAPAYFGHDSHFVLKANGQKQGGMPIMRFNPDYWDKSLPPSAIQFMTFWNGNFTQEEMDEQAQRSYPAYPQLLVNQFDWTKIAGLIMKSK